MLNKILIIIPAYNHSNSLRDVVSRALKVHPAVMVVDDGSSENVVDILSGLNVPVVSHPENLGKGSAILTGAREALKRGMTHIVTIDADGQHDPFDFKRFIPVLMEDPHAIIVGRRNFQNFKRANIPGSAVFGRSFSNFWLRVQTGQTLGDTQSGFRIYPLFVIERLKLRERRYSFEIEILVKAAWAGIRLREVDISVYYPPADKRISHFHLFKDNVRISLLNTRLTMRSILPWPHHKIEGINDRTSEKITMVHPMRSIKTLLKTLLAENISPKQLAAAGSLGVFLGTLPLIACHTIVILFAANFYRLNRVVSLSASQLCMPPLVPALCIETGYFLRHGGFLTEISMQTLGYQALERFYEWLIGSLIFAPVFAALVGSTIYITAFFMKRAAQARDKKRVFFGSPSDEKIREYEN